MFCGFTFNSLVIYPKYPCLRATDCNFGELADKSEIADFFIFCQEKPFSEQLLKTAFKLLKEFSFLRYPAKCEKPGLGPGRPENALKNRACWRLPGSKLKHRIATIFCTAISIYL